MEKIGEEIEIQCRHTPHYMTLHLFYANHSITVNINCAEGQIGLELFFIYFGIELILYVLAFNFQGSI